MVLALVVVTVSLALNPFVFVTAAEPAADPPDLTQRAKIDRSQTYNLGATGLRGWIHTRAATNFDGIQGRTTTSSRQILVTHVGRGSPADGVIEPGDVILGVDGGLFIDDARRSLAVAIQAAETETGNGVLRLTRWRAGTVEEVRLPLRVLGTYAATAPYDCPKSRRILDEACDVLAREPLTEDLFGAVNGLALLASGRPEVLPRVAEFARRLAAGAPTVVRDDMRTPHDFPLRIPSAHRRPRGATRHRGPHARARQRTGNVWHIRPWVFRASG